MPKLPLVRHECERIKESALKNNSKFALTSRMRLIIGGTFVESINVADRQSTKKFTEYSCNGRNNVEECLFIPRHYADYVLL